MEKNDIHRDRALFTRIADGNEQAFEELFHLYMPQLYRIIYNLVPVESTVKDLAQEVFLHLWLGREKLSEVEEPQHWIFRIAYNRSFKFLKRQQTEAAKLGTTDERLLHTNETEEAVQLSETIRLIREAIHELPAQQQRIYQLNRLSGKKPAEIAAELDISVQAVRNSLTRSGKIIREYLVERGIDIPLVIILLSQF
ncbi:sigma-70 family RNA polymerase sigma factor [Chitinophaga horti]|uniref:Sigma-70 family RNA polymerase sigma factor n=1 Tax=Chitinophaga horti TaxID=2920382 RepID=A0ABY6IUW0_9BACT|nr:sigma-70 family RNA polymerase sigma factor [Chitinophaga horti]UYQ91148.1 sigma-70 family RNA polymerase sigma factor [Chitinophaga horti]